MKINKLGFIGPGNMAQSIIKGILNNGYLSADQIYVYGPNQELANRLEKTLGINTLSSEVEVLTFCDYVILSVKPDVLESVILKIKDSYHENCVIASIVTGYDLERIRKLFGINKLKLVRAMPNLNAMVSESITAIAGNNHVSNEEMEIVSNIFKSIGKVTTLDEKYFNLFAAIGGSLPALAYLFIDIVSLVAVSEGLKKDLALEIVSQAVLGSAKTILETKLKPQHLVDLVCSPGGTTIRGVKSLLETNFANDLIKAVEAVIKRGKELEE